MKPIRFQVKLLGFFIVWLLSASVLMAAVAIDQSQESEDSSTFCSAGPSGSVAAQTITPVGDFLHKVELRIYDDNTTAPVATLKIYGGFSDYITPSSSKVLLGSVTLTVDHNTGDYAWVTFDFSKRPIDISKYNSSKGTGRLMFTLDAHQSSENVNYRYKTGLTTYGPGQFFVNDTLINGDMAFRVYTDNIIIYSPNPEQIYHNKATYGGVVAQSFTSSQNYIYKIDLVLYTASPGYIAQLEVKGGASDYVTPSTPGLVSLGSKTVDLGTWPYQGGYYWVTFDFSDNPIDIRNYNTSKGNGRLIFFLTNGGSNLVIYRYYMPNIYVPGQWFIGDTLMNGDMAFRVWAGYDNITTMTCGDLSTVYRYADFNMDCAINFLDFAILASQWLECVNPQDAQCNQFWLN